MNTLIIIAHPNKKSFSHILAYDYKIEKEKSWHTIRIIDLYDDQWQQHYLNMNETNRTLEDPLRNIHQELITWSDEICFFFPLWRFDCPAILKNRFDVNYTNGFAYKYRSGKAIPEKLLQNKWVRVFVTTWWPRRLYKTIGRCIITVPRLLWRIDYVGMKLKSRNRFTDMNNIRLPEERERMRRKVRSIANK